jgi:hypothetical protein
LVPALMSFVGRAVAVDEVAGLLDQHRCALVLDAERDGAGSPARSCSDRAAAWPAVALVGSCELLMMIVRSAWVPGTGAACAA